MKTYKFEKTVYYNDNYNIELILPDNIAFCEYMKYSDKQRFYFSVVKDPSEEMIALFKNAYHITKKIGNLLVGILNNVMPLCDIPEITIDEINKLYMEDLHKMYVVTECENQYYENYQRELMRMCINVEDTKDVFETDKAKELLDKLKSIDQFYIESIARPIRFVHGGDKGPYVECDVIQFKSWLDYDKIINIFQKTNVDITNWEEKSYIGPYSKTTIYMGDNAKPWKEMFENRIKEITKSAFG